MKYSESIKPISYLKTHASKVIRDVAKNQQTLVITHNGEAKVVFVHSVLDGRRDIQKLLEERLIVNN